MVERLQVEGIAPFINRLEKFDKDVSKDLKKEMRGGAAEVAKAAAAMIGGLPMSGWGKWEYQGRDLGFDPAKVKSGFKVNTNRYRRQGVTESFGYDVYQSNAGGNVFEVVGSGDRVNPDHWSGQQFVGQINDRFPGRRPRTLFAAYYKAIEKAQDRIDRAVQDAARRVGL